METTKAKANEVSAVLSEAKHNGPRPRFRCEHCWAFVLSSLETTVCDVCDKKQQAKEALVANAKALAWAATHKCRKCNKGLPTTRYFECDTCLPESKRELAWEWESIEGYDDDMEGEAPAPLFKNCYGCDSTHPLTSYGVVKRNKDGRGAYCPRCRKGQARDRRAKDKEKAAHAPSAPQADAASEVSL
jgi:hypothetical protein